jgi:hypothetical protein
MLLLLAKIMAYYGERSGSNHIVGDLWIGILLLAWAGPRRILPSEKFPAPRREGEFNLRKVSRRDERAIST